MYNVLIIEDQELLRKAYARVLQRREDIGFEICGFAARCADAVALAKANRPDAILLDLHLDGEMGTECIKPLLDVVPAADIIVVSNLADSALGVKALQLGAKALVDKRNKGITALISEVIEALTSTPEKPALSDELTKFLVIDDSDLVRYTVPRMLDSYSGKTVLIETAHDGVEGVRKAQALRPNLITLDLEMPNKDGLTALGEIMANDPNANVIVISGSLDDTRRIEALAGGAKFLLPKKELNRDSLINAVEAVLGNAA